MKKIDNALRDKMMSQDRDYLVYAAGDEYYLLGTILTNHGMSIDDALDLCGIDMDEIADEAGWDGWDYDNLMYVISSDVEEAIGIEH